MNLRRRKPHDSLYMLLDTMCNAFGGIILLAVLVVLLTSKEKSQSAVTGDSLERLQRRVALAQANLQESLQLAASLQARTTDSNEKEQLALLDQRKQLQDEIKLIRDVAAQDAKVIDANAGSDPTERLKALNAQIAAAEVKKLEAQNSLSASKEEEKQIKERLEAVKKQMAEVAAKSERQLRMPREHDTDRQVVYIIALYDRIYLCRNIDLSRNENDIKWTESRGVETADPIKAKGLDPDVNAAQLRTYFTAQAHNSVYVDFIVMGDSFPSFIRAKQLAVECELPYGWLPWRLDVDGPLSFSAYGYQPRPQ
jgi:hypothetical protein